MTVQSVCWKSEITCFENFTGAHKHMIDLAASTIPSFLSFAGTACCFRKTHPDVYFHSIQSDSSESISRVLDGTVDLALVGQNTRDESCVFIPFCHDELVIATPVTDHYLALKNRETPAVFHDFLKDPIILREKGSGTKKKWTFSGAHRHHNRQSECNRPHE